MTRYELVFEGECGNDGLPVFVKWVDKLPTRWEILNLPILVSEWAYTVDGVFTFRRGNKMLEEDSPYLPHFEPICIRDNDIPDLDDDYGEYFASVILQYLREDYLEFCEMCKGDVQSLIPAT